VVARSVRRLPGVQFESRPARLDTVLPRMDVAAFVGFAAAGPIDTPVAVADPRAFADLFGDDAELAWDRELCQPVRANLGPAVRAFLRNGGQRCWVVRVARKTATDALPNNWARANRFPVAGLVRLTATGIVPLFLAARSEGSWSDDLVVSGAVLLQPATINRLSVDAGVIKVALDVPDTVVIGDVLRLTWPSGDALLAPITAIDVDVATLATQRLWLLGAPPAAGGPWSAVFYPRDETPAPLPALDGDPAWLSDGTVSATFTAEVPLLPGQMLRLSRGSERAWILVTDARTVDRDVSPPARGTSFTGRWSRPAFSAPPGTLGSGVVPVVERVRVELWVQEGEGHPVRLTDLGLAAGHPRALGALPADRRLFDADEDLLSADEKALRDRLRLLAGDGTSLASYHAELWQSVATPRFPLAIDRGNADLFLPFAMPIVPESFLGAVAIPGDEAERNGLATFSADLFLDPALADATTDDLGAQADFIRWQQPAPRRLTGLHALYGVDEATLIATPDAVQRGWSRETTTPPSALATPQLSATADAAGQWHLSWSDVDPDAIYVLEQASKASFSDATPVTLAAPTATAYDVPPSVPSGTYYRVRAYRLTTAQPDYFVVADRESAGSFWSDPVQVIVPPPQFADCPPGALAVPVLSLADGPDASGSYRLTWTAVPGAVGYEVQESSGLDFADPVTVFLGDATDASLYGRATGRYHYRVRARGSRATVAAPVALAGDRFRVDVSGVATPSHILAAHYAGAIGDETVFDGAAFTEHFQGADNTRSALGDAFRYVLARDDGWPGAPSFTAWDPSSVGSFSNGVAVTVPSPSRHVQIPVTAYATTNKPTMLSVQAALLRLCAARGDLVAALSLPSHYRENEAARHGTELRGLLPEQTPWSYGALYHPWVLVEGDTALLPAPPDGAALGVMASRAVQRGAWIAPANEPLGDVLGLTPPIAREQWGRLLDAHVNLLRQEPHGFVTLSADTLADDPDLVPINVRRLLILLRRVALRLGPTFVFEPNSDSFRRAVEREFEAMLDQLFRGGAFAGASAADSYQVVVDTTVNSPESLDLGRFVVEIKVAPSLPLSFLTVRLTQSGSLGQVTEGL
jgi:hypothetical protein